GGGEVEHVVAAPPRSLDESAKDGQALPYLDISLAVHQLLAGQEQAVVAALLARGIAEGRVPVRVVVRAGAVPSGQAGRALRVVDEVGQLADEETAGPGVDAELGPIGRELVDRRIRVEGAE